MISMYKYRRINIKIISILVSIFVPLSAFATRLSDNSRFTVEAQLNEVLRTSNDLRKTHNKNSEKEFELQKYVELQKHGDIYNFFITAFVSGTITYITSAGVKYLIKKIIPKKTKKEVTNPYI